MKNRLPFRTALLFSLLGLLAAGGAFAQPPADATIEPGSLARSAAADYRAQARYPDHARALEAIPAGQARPVDPVRARHTPAPHSLAGPGGEPPALEVWSGAVAFQAPEPVELYAILRGPGRHEAVITGEVVDPSGVVIGEVTYLDDGVGADERAGDGIHTTRFELPEGSVPELAGSFLVKVHATLADGDFRGGSAGFLYTSPWATLTGAFSDRVEDGDLVISAEVEVERAGRFHLEGALHTMSGQPVGWAQTAVELEPGVHRVDLSFYGLMFHDRGATGPLRLGTVALTTTGAMPNGLGDPLLNAHVTRPIQLQRMTAEPFGRRDLIQAAERLERGAGR